MSFEKEQWSRESGFTWSCICWKVREASVSVALFFLRVDSVTNAAKLRGRTRSHHTGVRIIVIFFAQRRERY